MKLLAKHVWFLAFTAVFAALAGFVFWGTWSPDVAPVMPDCATTHSANWISDWIRGFCENGKFVPDDLKVFLCSPYYLQEFQYAFAAYCAALGLAYFLRGRGLSPLASYGAGLLLAFSGYWFSLFSAGHLGWFRWMTYGVFAFGLIDRAIAGGKLRHWLLWGACVAWASFYQSDLWLLFTVLTGAYFIFRSIGARSFDWKGMLAAAAVFFAIGGPSFKDAIGSGLKGRDEQIAQGQTLGAAAQDKDADEKRWIFVTNWSLPPNESLEFFIPRLNGDTSCPFTLAIGARHRSGVKPYAGALGRPKDAPSGNYRQHSLYVGLITCLLALVGSLSGLGNRTIEQSNNLKSNNLKSNNQTIILFFLIAAVVFWLFSMGRYCEPVYRLVYMLPFGDYLRAPVKWHHLTEFCLCVLAGFGLDLLGELLSRVSCLASWSGILVGIVAVIGATDLARIDRLYCAPVDYAEARRTNASAQLTFLPKQQFADPRVQQMVRNRQIQSVAYYPGRDDVYLVEVLTPREKQKDGDISPFSNLLGMLSVLTTLGVSIYCISASMRSRNMV